MKHNQFAYLHISSWAMALNGEHYYADIRYGEEYISELRYQLTEEQAHELNVKDTAGLAAYEEGDECGRFFGRDHVILVAMSFILNRWPEVKVIVLNDGCSAQPVKMAWCYDDDIKEAANTIWLQMETLYEQLNDPWTYAEKEMDLLCDEWDRVLEKL